MISSVIKAMAIMELFTPIHPRLTLAQISDSLDMPKSTVHNLLNTLLSEGYIEKVDSDQYALGMKLISLTQSVRVNVELRDRAAPLLRKLSDATGESAYLTVLDDHFALYIYAIESSQRLLARTAIGERAHLHCTSVGKVLMAFLPEEQIDAIINDVGLPKFTPHSITNREEVLADLAGIRERGYAIDNEEHEPNTYCLGAPIYNEHEQVVGAFSISGADAEIIGERQKSLVDHLLYTSQEISRRMGYVPLMRSQIRVSPDN